MCISSKLLSCLLALAVSLTACAAAPDAATSATTTSTPEPTSEAAPIATPAPQPAAPLTMFQSASIVMGEDVAYEKFYKLLNAEGDSRVFATTIDYATGRQQILCRKPGCSHTDESCAGFLMDSPLGSQTAAFLIPVGDKLYWIVDGGNAEPGSTYIDTSDLDGSNRQRVTDGLDLPSLSYVEDWFTDGTALYVTMHAPGSFYLFRINESGTEYLFWTPMQGQDYYKVVGCWQDKFVLMYAADYVQPELGDAATQEEFDAFDEAWEAARNGQPYTLFLVDTEGNKTDTAFHWTLGDGSITKVDDGIAYLLGADGTVTKMDLAIGASTSHQLDLPARVWSNLGSIPLRDYVTVYMEAPDNCNNEYLLNQDTGEYFQLPTTWFKDQTTPRNAYVVAAGDDLLYVMYNEIYYTKNDIGPDGQPYSFTTCRDEYGFISMDDYLAGNQNWLPITFLDDGQE